MAKGESGIHSITLRLDLTSEQAHNLDKRFRCINRCHNTVVRHAKELMEELGWAEGYQCWLKRYREVSAVDESKLSNEEQEFNQKIREGLSKCMSEFRKAIGLSEYGFHDYIVVFQKNNSHLISSHQAQVEASRVWKGVEKVLFGDGNEIHFKNLSDQHTIGGKSANNGIVFDTSNYSIRWTSPLKKDRLIVRCKLPKRKKDIDYFRESINHKVKYCDIMRRMFNDGWHYYVIVYLEGTAPKKLDNINTQSITGIDPGVSTIAAVSDTTVHLEELAPNTDKYDKEIYKVQQHMERSLRTLNPDNYNKDGTIRKGRKTWIKSKEYNRAWRKLKTLYRKKSEYIQQSHNILANRIITNGVNLIVEDMDFAALALKVKETSRQDTETTITQKDGTIKKIRKYKKKKRFGKSINRRAPSQFVTTLKRKCQQYDGDYRLVNTRKYKASQYDHVKDEYIKVPLSARFKNIGNDEVQRDLYSAFLISNADLSNLDDDCRPVKPDRNKCIQQFDNFVSMQNEQIKAMKDNGISMKQCFGF